MIRKEPGSAASRERWLLLFNCQATGLGRCITLLTDRVELVVHDPESIAARRAAILSGIGDFDRVIVDPGTENHLKLDLGRARNLWRMPALFFTGYHPDTCYLASEGALARGPLGHYHSAMTYAAFRCGMSEQQTLALFNRGIFEQLGYFDRWNVDRDRLFTHYQRNGWDIRESFVRWTRRGPFMHTINHPKIFCLHDLARMLLDRAGLEVMESDALPYDNLANGPGFPVYPEIGTRTGAKGSYIFKRPAAFQTMPLSKFVAESFDVYENNRNTSPTFGSFLKQIETTIAVIEAQL